MEIRLDFGQQSVGQLLLHKERSIIMTIIFQVKIVEINRIGDDVIYFIDDFGVERLVAVPDREPDLALFHRPEEVMERDIEKKLFALEHQSDIRMEADRFPGFKPFAQPQFLPVGDSVFSGVSHLARIEKSGIKELHRIVFKPFRDKDPLGEIPGREVFDLERIFRTGAFLATAENFLLLGERDCPVPGPERRILHRDRVGVNLETIAQVVPFR